MAQELKDYDIMDIEAMDDERLEKSSTGKIFVTRVYIKDEVDAVLAEKDKEIERLDDLAHAHNIELLRKENLLAEKDKEIRWLKRALWLTRAERAASWQIHFALCHNHSIEREFIINGASTPRKGMVTMRTARDWAIIWKKVERKFLAKAEEYK